MPAEMASLNDEKMELEHIACSGENAREHYDKEDLT